jgi:hypothetical protein
MSTTSTETVTLNTSERLYVISTSGGVCCLGFDVCADRIQRYAKALGIVCGSREAAIGTLDNYNFLMRLQDTMRASGKRYDCDLTPALVGLEGKRVEVVDCYGETRRFYVGKSTGFIPVHLEIAKRGSNGGPAVMCTPFRSVRVI